MNAAKRFGLQFLATCLVVGSLTTSAWAANVSIALDNVQSWDSLGDSDNTRIVVDIAAQLGLASGSEVVITAIAYDVFLQTQGGSWLSEAQARLGSTDGLDFLDLRPGAGMNSSGSGAFASDGFIDLASLGPDYTILLADGLLTLEFFEDYDDVQNVVDATWVSGSISVTAVPLPAGLPLFFGALATLSVVRRRTAATQAQ